MNVLSRRWRLSCPYPYGKETAMETTITFFDGAVQPGRRITMSAVTRSGVCQLGA
jgi:hypothetical protein